ncbi:MAG: hypothetical protein ACFFD1_00720 [Candidatus Thorarchaeota archaeon]
MSSGVSRVQVRSFYGTGADMNVRTFDFRPKRIEVFNISGLCKADWVEGMADDSAVKTVTAGTMSLITTNGITPLSNGFSLGADSDLNVSGELCRAVAYE